MTSWSPIAITDSVSGSSSSIVYQFNSSKNSDVADFNPSSWTTVTSGAVPTNSTAPYVAFRATFTATDYSSTVSLDEFKISWAEGIGAQPVVAWNHDRRYWLAFTTNTTAGATNDRVLLYQRNRSWSLFSGINAVSFATWRDALYFGNSNSTGYVYKFDIGNNDDGSDISSKIVFKSYDAGLFNQDKDFKNLYVNYLGAANGSLSLVYDLDRSGNAFSLGSANMNEGTGQVAAKFPFSLANPVQGREIQYTLTKSGTGDRLKLYDLKTTLMLKEAR